LIELSRRRERHPFCDCILDVQTFVRRHPIAELIQAFGHLVPEVTALGQYLDRALGNAAQVGNVLLPGLSIDTAGFLTDFKAQRGSWYAVAAAWGSACDGESSSRHLAAC
jgi:hypothetical protein